MLKYKLTTYDKASFTFTFTFNFGPKFLLDAELNTLKPMYRFSRKQSIHPEVIR